MPKFSLKTALSKNPEISFYDLDTGQLDGLSIGKTVTITLTGTISRLSDSDYCSSIGIRPNKIEIDGKELSMEETQRFAGPAKCYQVKVVPF